MSRPEFDIAPFAFREEHEEAAWEAELPRGPAPPRPARAAPPRSTRGAPRRPQPPTRRPRTASTRFDVPPAPCVCPAHGTEFVRWVQSTLNRVEAAGLPVNGVMNAASRNALRRFQRRKRLPPDGIAGPDTEKALLDSRSAAPESELEAEAEAGFEEQFSFVGFPQPVLDALRAKNESAAIQRAAAAGFRDENTLTDLVFFARHPERQGAPLRRDEPGFSGLATEWLGIRDRLVRATPQPPAAGPAAPAVGAPDIVNVRGIYVSRQIAPQIDALLAAAEADGVPLTGGGYRSPAEQIETRKKNCGPTPYDIYDKPSSECSPPTAKPGTSMHERGLAIDFRYGTQMREQFKGTPGFDWLQRNAWRFKLKNFAKEPWHWSTTGT